MMILNMKTISEKSKIESQKAEMLWSRGVIFNWNTDE